jgi:hypothetical protein
MLRLVFLMLVPLVAVAQPAPRSGYFPAEAEGKPWEEQKLQLPPIPAAENLVRVQVDDAQGFTFFVDSASVSVGTDDVVRYTLVARSESGATNISFEGIKCKTRERKLYAIGRADNTWSPARNSQWTPISELPVNRVQAVLFGAYFCPARIIVRNTDDARRVLKLGGDPRASGSAELWNQPR